MGRVTSTTAMRALQGRTIVITRAAAQAHRFVELLEAEGARVLAAPTIAIDPPPSWEALDAALDARAQLGRAVFRRRAPSAPRGRHRRVDRADHRRHGRGIRSPHRRHAERIHDPRADPCPRRILQSAAPDPGPPSEKECLMAQGVYRPRRLREKPLLRKMVRETALTVDDLVYPLFVVHGRGVREEIGAMPGQFQLSIDELAKEAKDVAGMAIPALLLFAIPEG